MSMWDQHKKILVVAGAFFGLLFLLWLFGLRGYANEVAAHREAFEKDEKTRDKLCPEQGTKVRLLNIMFTNANGKLAERLAELKQSLNYAFSEAVIPPGEVKNRQIYVRKELATLKQFASIQFETNRQIEMSDAAADLGFAIPNDMNESLATDETWLRQMAAVRQVLGLLLSVHEQPDGSKTMLALHSIQALPPSVEEAPCNFIKEYPIRVEMHMRLAGLMDLLQRCRRPDGLYVVQSLEILGTPAERVSQVLDNKRQAQKEKRPRYERWNEHYYRINLTLSLLSLSDPEKADEATVKVKSSGPIKVIPH